MDVIGSFECECNSGFEGNGVDCTGKKSQYAFGKGENVPHLHGYSIIVWLTIEWNLEHAYETQQTLMSVNGTQTTAM